MGSQKRKGCAKDANGLDTPSRWIQGQKWKAVGQKGGCAGTAICEDMKGQSVLTSFIDQQGLLGVTKGTTIGAKEFPREGKAKVRVLTKGRALTMVRARASTKVRVRARASIRAKARGSIGTKARESSRARANDSNKAKVRVLTTAKAKDIGRARERGVTTATKRATNGMKERAARILKEVHPASGSPQGKKDEHHTQSAGGNPIGRGILRRHHHDRQGLQRRSTFSITIERRSLASDTPDGVMVYYLSHTHYNVTPHFAGRQSSQGRGCRRPRCWRLWSVSVGNFSNFPDLFPKLFLSGGASNFHF